MPSECRILIHVLVMGRLGEWVFWAGASTKGWMSPPDGKVRMGNEYTLLRVGSVLPAQC